jgi:hypothetical protein
LLSPKQAPESYEENPDGSEEATFDRVIDRNPLASRPERAASHRGSCVLQELQLIIPIMRWRMDGSSRGWQLSPQLKREFAGSRLEDQILIRVFELVVPVIRRGWRDDERSGIGQGYEQFNGSFAKGA